MSPLWSILVVDDSFLVRTQLRSTFEAHGARVLEAENGSQGRWRALQDHVDLVVTDLHMPVMDGLTMIRELRQLPQHATTPIIVLTTDGAEERIEAAKKLGATAWIRKPFQPEQVWKAVDKMLFARLGKP